MKNSSLFFFYCSLLAAVSVHASVFHGLAGLGPQSPTDPATNPRAYRHNYTHVDWRGRTTAVQYDTELSENVIKINTLEKG